LPFFLLRDAEDGATLLAKRERVLWENERREIGIGRISRVRPFSNVPPLSLLRFRAGSKTGVAIQARRAERALARKQAGISHDAVDGPGRLVTEPVLRGLDRRHAKRAARLAALLDEDAAAPPAGLSFEPRSRSRRGG
jgi:hypothetical protein